MKDLLFWDPARTTPYGAQAPREEFVDATAANLVRVAAALGARIVRHGGTPGDDRGDGAHAVPGITHVVVHGDPDALPQVTSLYPDARCFLWIHDPVHPGSPAAHRLARWKVLMKARAVTVVCSTDAQLDAVRKTLRHLGIDGYIRTCRIYNAVDDDLVSDGTPVDREKLVFFGAPGEGLAFAIDAFRAMRRAMPALRLCVGTSTLRGATPRIGGVTWLRPQPLSRVHDETRSALCSICPNLSDPDSFGQSIAESLAVGTPVLAHDIGCSGELVQDRRQLLPATRSLRAYERMLDSIPSGLRLVPATVAARAGLFDAYIERVRDWRERARPETGPDPRFRLAKVAGEWENLLAA